MMRILYQLLAAVGLAMILVPSLLYYFDSIPMDQMKMYMFIGTVLWFAGAIPWLGKKKNEA